ncbi:MAG TPA: VCBS repeat-containing protein, partial [Chthoniobacteraceae bacterium]
MRTVRWKTGAFAALGCLMSTVDAAPIPKFHAVEVDAHLGVGSDLAIADVDGDGKPDLLVADRQALVWYQNPNWERRLIAGKLCEYEHITISAATKDGQPRGKLERLAVTDGTPWDPASTHGASFYLTPGADRTQPWTAKPLPINTTAHRSGWWF